jgi:uncharacterized lipoprotein YddW (UPF0748 family)
MMMKALKILLLAKTVTAFVVGLPATDGSGKLHCQTVALPQVVRSAWVTNVGSPALTSKVEIEKTVALAKQSGLTHLCVVVWNRGYTQYKSATMQRLFGVAVDPAYGGRDPLREMVAAAHASGIKVIAWFEFGFSYAYADTGHHIIAKYPQWAAKDADGKILKENGFSWMNAFDPEVQQFMTSLVQEVVRGYDVDGVQGDDRLPALPVRGGYDGFTTNLYRKAHDGKFPPTNHNDTAWVNWRCKLLNAYGRQLYGAVKSIKPQVLVVHAPSLWPWSKEKYLQDWPTWLAEGSTDLVMPQLYRYKLADYQRIVDETLQQVGIENRSKIFPGILTALADGFLISDELLEQCIAYNRSIGILGESFFYFESLRRSPRFYHQRYKAMNAKSGHPPNHAP